MLLTGPPAAAPAADGHIRPAGRPTVVAFMIIGWGVFHRRQLLEAIAEQLPVIIVDVPMTLAGLLHPRGAIRWLLRRGRTAGNPPVIRPFMPFSYATVARFPFLGSVNRIFLRPWLRSALAGAEPVTLLFRPEQWWLTGILEEARDVYEVYDPYPLHPALPSDRAVRIQAMHRRLLESADLVVSTSVVYGRELGAEGFPVSFVPNATDTAPFRAEPQPPGPPLDALLPLPRPRVGFVGAVNENVDVRLLRDAAAGTPGVTFCIAGPLRFAKSSVWDRRTFDELVALPNVRYLGPIPFAKIPAFLREMDCALLPFVRNNYIDRVYPAKIHQYFEAGVPVIGVRTEEMVPFEPYVHLFDGTEELIALLDLLGREALPAREPYPGDNDWRERAARWRELLLRMTTGAAR